MHAIEYRPVDGGEKSIGLGKSGINLGHIQTLCQRQIGFINCRAAHHKHFTVGQHHAVGHGNGGSRFGPFGHIVGVLRQHHVAALGEGALGEALPRAPPHKDGVALGERLEMAQVVAQMTQQPVSLAYGTALRDGHDDGYFGYTNCFIHGLLWG